MKVVFAVDVHGCEAGLEQLPAADLAVLGGDLTSFGTVADVRRIVARVQARYPRVLAVLGNCDPPAAGDLLGELGVSLHLRAEVHDGVQWLGLGGSNPTPFHTPNEWDEAEMEPRLAALTVPTAQEPMPLIMVTHAPPRGSGADRLPNGGTAGSVAVAAWVAARRPALVLCGHIHEATGVFWPTSLTGAPVVNPGAFRQGRYAVVEVDLQAGLIGVEFGRLET